jgi:hypothetical protein
MRSTKICEMKHLQQLPSNIEMPLLFEESTLTVLRARNQSYAEKLCVAS